jgi:hypothetical protein
MHARVKPNRSSDERDATHRVTTRPSAGVASTASAPVQRMLDLQRAAGNAAVARMVEQAAGSQSGNSNQSGNQSDSPSASPSASPSSTPAIQRTVWEFSQGANFSDPRNASETRWVSRDNPNEVRTSAQLGINGHAAPRHGDIYDDATGQVYSSANATFGKKGTIPDREYPGRESQTRRALVEAKQAIATALTLLSAAGSAPSGQLLTALQSGFPVFRSATPEQVAAFLPRIVEVVRRIQAGLNAHPAEFTLVANGQVPRGVAGWVGPSWKDFYTRVTNPNQQKSEDLPPMDTGRSGPINLTEEGQSAWYVIHEATHRFAGTLDYQYSAHDSELQEEQFLADMAVTMPDAAAQTEENIMGKRVLRDPSEYSGENKESGRQENWYAMGQRALMNADSYAQFILIAAGARAPRF